ncbi:Transcriptional regulator, TetR family OS=Tsukamurella paurometabola (strain ATCC 8368 / DSM/ CCUG 35730 / CIP 100753 / JCM 10117 / KCTC 9821 / NBRC 16120/ NCIMB 702349 / NCTC 13040) OX=521096 GN=Tpau_0590 PE=4 SV=1 [Tsukamurella paurometabola]|uniref:Transcriptional regulator, TetR family n=1 Tax=Tsukamurella paurometabola (strain ATCC 8368 / DSM 20162 / CCUG 35730 / CIP 100753 / JCM 10117 / KCTC 9821 / NBRC 16120 / NCIMB 702349 / NCTC 13040) TaxID=521096 RepID=D5USU1_TSUPD|nr:TetR family transcriptional regulator [Tsukamurella paurometabola]ADG77228.1 transcriptional regulator, TetR family [Tsukamurella paurometabola DSM 20162]SUP43221.1 Probable acrEF/envCD operon repressor [Tsukamurella paurometabola]
MPPAPRQQRDAAATKARLLDAATAEFAEYGLAGARVDRIATAAEANKQLIYAYFGNKRQLFDAVIEFRVADLLETVPFTADDLSGYAVRLRAFNRAHPELMRLVLWHTLECPGELAELELASGSNAKKIAALQAAQDAGTVTAGTPAPTLLIEILALIHGDILTAGGDVAALALDDAALAAAVEKLTAP